MAPTSAATGNGPKAGARASVASETGPTEPQTNQDEIDPAQAETRGKWVSIASLLVLIAFSMVSVVLTIAHNPKLSQIDEAAHIDSVFRAPGVARTGELMLPETLAEISCRGGLAGMDFVPPACGVYQATPAPGYPVGGGGYNTADIHPPTYYYLTKLAITVGGWVTPFGPVTLMRLTGALWLALASCLTWLLARRLGAGRAASFGAAAVLAAGFSVQELSAIVNVDAMVPATGAAFALVALHVWPRRMAWWVIPLAAVVVMFVKMTNIAGLVVVCLFLLIREATPPLSSTSEIPPGAADRFRAWWSASGAGVRRALGIGVVTAAAAGLALAVWSMIRAARALVPGESLPIAQQFLIDHLTLAQVFSQAFSFTAPTEFLPNGLSQKFLAGGGVFAQVALVALWCLLMALTVAAWFRDRQAFAALAATMVALISMPLVYVVLNYVASGQYFTPWFRYGFSMMPFAAAAVAVGCRRRFGGGVFAVLGGLGMVIAVVAA